MDAKFTYDDVSSYGLEDDDEQILLACGPTRRAGRSG
jgi:hypothetical protein